MRNTTTLHPRIQPRKRAGRNLAALEKLRANWVKSLGSLSPFLPLFDLLPGVSFFAKDRQGRAMFVNRAILRRYHMSDEREMLGLTDHDINPAVMADSYVKDDRQLLAGRVKRIERLELWFDQVGLPDWYVVVKLPLLDKRGRPCGVMGVLRRAEEADRRLPLFQTVARAVEIMRRDYAQPLVVADIAVECGESVRQLQRHFQAAFGVTPQEFLIRTRVLAAARMLEETTLSSAEISQQCGFVDSSSFSLHFKKRTGLSPTAYRQSAGFSTR